MTGILLALFLALACSALFAGAETAWYATPRLRLQHAAKNSRRGRWLARVSQSTPGYLCTLLVGNNLANNAVVHAAAALFLSLGVRDPHLFAGICLVPVLFLVCEVIPKRWMLHHSLERSIAVAPALALARILLFPLAAPLGLLLRQAGLEEPGPGPRQLRAVLLEPGEEPIGETEAKRAAHRALESPGRGLAAYLRPTLLWQEAMSLADARLALALEPSGLALLASERGPLLLQGERLAVASDRASLLDLAEEIPQLDPHLDLSGALESLREADARFAWVALPGQTPRLLDLEHMLGLLFSGNPLPAPS